jgi:hypothetical protein
MEGMERDLLERDGMKRLFFCFVLAYTKTCFP